MTGSTYEELGKSIVTKAGSLSKAQRDGLRALLSGFDEPQLPFPSYSVIMKYDQTVEQMIKAGKYNWFNNDITSGHFPSSVMGQADLLIYLVSFDHNISSEDAIKELGSMTPPLHPATLKELLTLGATQPDLQLSNPIVAIGSTWRFSGNQMMPGLVSVGSLRYLSLFSLFGGWGLSWQFAAVRR